MQKSFEIGQGVPEIWRFKELEMILLRETKNRKNTTVIGQAYTLGLDLETDLKKY